MYGDIWVSQVQVGSCCTRPKAYADAENCIYKRRGIREVGALHVLAIGHWLVTTAVHVHVHVHAQIVSSFFDRCEFFIYRCDTFHGC